VNLRWWWQLHEWLMVHDVDYEPIVLIIVFPLCRLECRKADSFDNLIICSLSKISLEPTKECGTEQSLYLQKNSPAPYLLDSEIDAAIWYTQFNTHRISDVVVRPEPKFEPEPQAGRT
jgi:hypothetical protein